MPDAAATPPAVPAPPPAAFRAVSWRGLPLVLAYGAGPLLLALEGLGLHAGTGPGGRDVLSLWLGLAGVGLMLALVRSGRAGPGHSRATAAAAALAAGAVLALAALAWGRPVPPRAAALWLGELRPLVFVGLGLAWAGTVGPPGRAAWLRAGGLLGLALLLDALGGLAAAWLGVRFGPGGLFFPWTLSRVEGLSLLLLLAHAAGLGPAAPAGRGPGLWRWLVLAGLLLGQSTTALLAALGMSVLWDRGRPGRAAAGAALGLGLALSLGGAMLLPQPEGFVVSRLQWVGALTALARDPGLLLAGVGPAGTAALPVPWSVAQALGIPAMELSLPPRLLASGWLRLLLVWGALGVLVPAAALGWAGRRVGAWGRAALLAVAGQGLFYPCGFEPGGVVLAVLAAAASAREAAGGPVSGAGAAGRRR
ncbi:MAG: hypothetical protein AB7D57_02905 [Desulfovibrionaceae bacterium]